MPMLLGWWNGIAWIVASLDWNWGDLGMGMGMGRRDVGVCPHLLGGCCGRHDVSPGVVAGLLLLVMVMLMVLLVVMLLLLLLLS